MPLPIESHFRVSPSLLLPVQRNGAAHASPRGPCRSGSSSSLTSLEEFRTGLKHYARAAASSSDEQLPDQLDINPLFERSPDAAASWDASSPGEGSTNGSGCPDPAELPAANTRLRDKVQKTRTLRALSPLGLCANSPEPRSPVRQLHVQLQSPTASMVSFAGNAASSSSGLPALDGNRMSSPKELPAERPWHRQQQAGSPAPAGAGQPQGLSGWLLAALAATPGQPAPAQCGGADASAAHSRTRKNASLAAAVRAALAATPEAQPPGCGGPLHQHLQGWLALRPTPQAPAEAAGGSQQQTSSATGSSSASSPPETSSETSSGGKQMLRTHVAQVGLTPLLNKSCVSPFVTLRQRHTTSMTSGAPRATTSPGCSMMSGPSARTLAEPRDKVQQPLPRSASASATFSVSSSVGSCGQRAAPTSCARTRKAAAGVQDAAVGTAPTPSAAVAAGAAPTAGSEEGNDVHPPSARMDQTKHTHTPAKDVRGAKPGNTPARRGLFRTPARARSTDGTSDTATPSSRRQNSEAAAGPEEPRCAAASRPGRTMSASQSGGACTDEFEAHLRACSSIRTRATRSSAAAAPPLWQQEEPFFERGPPAVTQPVVRGPSGKVLAPSVLFTPGNCGGGRRGAADKRTSRGHLAGGSGAYSSISSVSYVDVTVQPNGTVAATVQEVSSRAASSRAASRSMSGRAQPPPAKARSKGGLLDFITGLAACARPSTRYS